MKWNGNCCEWGIKQYLKAYAPMVLTVVFSAVAIIYVAVDLYANLGISAPTSIIAAMAITKAVVHK